MYYKFRTSVPRASRDKAELTVLFPPCFKLQGENKERHHVIKTARGRPISPVRRYWPRRVRSKQALIPKKIGRSNHLKKTADMTKGDSDISYFRTVRSADDQWRVPTSGRGSLQSQERQPGDKLAVWEALLQPIGSGLGHLLNVLSWWRCSKSSSRVTLKCPRSMEFHLFLFTNGKKGKINGEKFVKCPPSALSVNKLLPFHRSQV